MNQSFTLNQSLDKKIYSNQLDNLTIVRLRHGRNVAIQFGNICKDGDKMINSDDQHRTRGKKKCAITKLSSSNLEQKKLLSESDLCPLPVPVGEMEDWGSDRIL